MLSELLDTTDFPRRWSCGNWTPFHGWTHVIADSAIFCAYAAIPATIAYFVIRKGRVQLPPLWWMFAAFILFCGIGHLIEATIFWHPWYRLSAVVKVITALASWGTVGALIVYLPEALAMPDAARLNEELKHEIERQWVTEEQLRASEQEWRALTETVPDIIFTADSDGRCTFVNRRFLDYSGRKFEDFLGEGWTDALHPDDRERTIAAWSTARTSKESFEIEYRFRSAAGDYGWFIGRSSPVLQSDGNVKKWIGCATDITERRRAVEDLRRSEERFRTVVEAAPNAMIMVDAGGRIVLINSQTESLFGYVRGELLGQPVELLVPERFRDSHPEHRRGFMQMPHARAMGAGRDLYGLRKDGTEVPIEIGLNPIQTASGTAVLASIIDITERKRAEDAIRTSLAEKETLLKEIHHRVKNNLQVTSSLLQLQARQLNEPNLMRPFRESQDRIRSMALIHEKLYQSGSLASIDLGEYLRSLVTMIQRSYSEDDRVTLKLDVEPSPVEVDIAAPIGLLVNELVTNAFKYAFPDKRPGQIVVAFHRTGPECLLEVRDNGIGLPADFEPENGKSLGMRLVRIFVRQLNAQHSLENGNPGLVFQLRFNLDAEPPVPPAGGRSESGGRT